MDEKYSLTYIGILDADTQKWYEAEQCWNCEPDQLRKMQLRNHRSVRKPFIKLFYQK